MIVGFINGLGFENLRAMLDTMTAGVHGLRFRWHSPRAWEKAFRSVADAFCHLAGGVLGGMKVA